MEIELLSLMSAKGIRIIFFELLFFERGYLSHYARSNIETLHVH